MKNKQQKKKVSKFAIWAIKWTFEILYSIIAMIMNLHIRRFVKYNAETIEQLIEVLTDANPKNKEQVEDHFKANWKTHSIESLEFTRYLLSERLKDSTEKEEILSLMAVLQNHLQELKGEHLNDL